MKNSRWKYAVSAALILATPLGGCAKDTTSSNASSKSSSEASSDTKLAKVALTPVGTAKPLKLGVRSTLPTVVNVWATWCVPCRKELPDFNAAAAKYAKTVRFVGVNAGQTVAEAEGFIAEIGVTFDQYVDEEFALQSTLSLTGMPTTVFLDTSGAVVKINQGSMNAASLDATIGEVFGATPSP